MIEALLIVIFVLLVAIFLILAFPIYDIVKKNYEVNKSLAEWFKRSEVTSEMVFDGKRFTLQSLEDSSLKGDQGND